MTHFGEGVFDRQQMAPCPLFKGNDCMIASTARLPSSFDLATGSSLISQPHRRPLVAHQRF